MNKNMRFSWIGIFTLLFLLSACQQKKEVQPTEQQADSATVASPQSVDDPSVASYSTVTKGKIETMREIPVYSRIGEQIIVFSVENLGQYVKKGELVARLSDASIQDKIVHARAKLEKAEFQYQAILMGQGYKRDQLAEAPEKIKQLARINSGYNEAKAELRELEHRLSYCIITAPVSGAVSKICNTLYGAAQPGEPLFYLVDIEHLKVSFLENELAKYENGASLSVSTLTFPSEHHKATVSAVDPVIDDNGMVHIEATLEPHRHLAPGMTAFVSVVSPEEE